jgi:RNase P protein component
LRSDAIWLAGHGKQWRRDHPGEQAPEHAIVVRERKNASGLQLSFWRAVEVLAAELREGWTTDKAARLAAENVLVEALSDRQREQLAKRAME